MNQVDICAYQLVLCVNVHRELTTLHECPVDGLNDADTGAHSMEEVLAKIETGTDFDVEALLPIYEAYCAAKVGDGTSATLRDAIGLRLGKAKLEPVVIDLDTD